MSPEPIEFAALEQGFRPSERWPWERGELSCLLGGYVGDGFSAYGRILHPVFEDLEIGEWGSVWDMGEDAPFHRGEPEGSFSARGLKWHDLAEDLEIDYEAGMPLSAFLPHLPKGRWPRALVGPVDGTLDMERLRQVIRLTRDHLDPGDCVFAWVQDRCFGDVPRAYRGALEELRELYDGEHTMGAPTFWGDAAGSFRFVSPPDRPWTVLAGPEPWLEVLCEHKPLDAERLEPGCILQR